MSEQTQGAGRIRLDTAGRIVVGTDGSERARKAVDWAADRALARGLLLLIVMVIPGPQIGRTFHRGHRRVPDPVQAAMPTAVECRTGAAARTIRRWTSRPNWWRAMPPMCWLRRPRMRRRWGARGRRAPISVKLLGGVSDAVASHAHGPVAVITDEAQENPGGPVVVGIDDSNEARAAAKLAS